MKNDGRRACCKRNPSDVLAASGELTGELTETGCAWIAVSDLAILQAQSPSGPSWLEESRWLEETQTMIYILYI
jgi:hypothetical protein